MKYMLMMFGDQVSMMETRSVGWMMEMFEFMKALDGELEKTGEFVDQQELANPSRAMTVRVGKVAPVATTGPFTGADKSLSRFWVVDVEDEARAIQIASRIVALTQVAVEVRQCMEDLPEW